MYLVLPGQELPSGHGFGSVSWLVVFVSCLFPVLLPMTPIWAAALISCFMFVKRHHDVFFPSVSYSSLHLTLTPESGSHGEVVVINPQQLLGPCTPLFGYIRSPFRHGTGSLGKLPLEGILLHKQSLGSERKTICSAIWWLGLKNTQNYQNKYHLLGYFSYTRWIKNKIPS